ncbi:MAG: MFS transporter [Tissierellia bacterium]|nr:MFS transporter [Tissierellia bacterium]
MEYKNKKLIVLAILLTSIVMRASFTGIGSIIPIISQDLQLDESISGMISTLPLIIFFLFPVIVNTLNDIVGTKTTMVGATVIVILGISIRSFGSLSTLFLGTGLMGIGITFYNVLLPSIIKNEFPHKVGMITGLYTMMITISSGICFAITPKLAMTLKSSWRGALFFWIYFALITLLLWMFTKNDKIRSEDANLRGVLKNPMTIYVSMFFGLQALLYFSFVTWFPTILHGRGIPLESTGLLGMLFQFIGVPVNFLIPTMAEKAKDQRIYGLVTSSFFVGGLILFYFANSMTMAIIAIIVLGLGSCSTLSLCFAFITFRSETPAISAQVSAIAQIIGNILAAIGPVGLGFVYRFTNSWSIAILILIGISVVFTIFGTLSGRDVSIV